MFNATIRSTYAELHKTAMAALPKEIRDTLLTVVEINKGIR